MTNQCKEIFFQYWNGIRRLRENSYAFNIEKLWFNISSKYHTDIMMHERFCIFLHQEKDLLSLLSIPHAPLFQKGEL